MTPTGLEPVLLVSKTKALPVKLRSLFSLLIDSRGWDSNPHYMAPKTSAIPLGDPCKYKNYLNTQIQKKRITLNQSTVLKIYKTAPQYRNRTCVVGLKDRRSTIKLIGNKFNV